MKIVYFSKGLRGRVCLQELVRCGHSIEAVVASDADEHLAALCTEHKLALHVQSDPNTTAFAHFLTSLSAELFICSGYNKILKPFIFRIPPRGTINLHGGRLPQYRGAAPINWQIISGEVAGGCSVLFMDEGIDTGPIIKQELYAITEEDTHQSVLEKTLQIFPRLLRETLRDMESGSLSVVVQQRDEGCYFSRRFPEDSRIDWSSLTDRQVHNLVRGMHGPFPHAFTFWGNEKIEVERTSLLSETVKGVPGRVALRRADGIVVVCRNRGMLIEEIQFRGQPFNPRDLIKAGEKFG